VRRTAVLPIAAVALGALLVSCQVRGAQVVQSPLLKFFERSSGLITYVAADGNVGVIDQKGGRTRALTRDAARNTDASVLYASPTWSPDGTLVAFERLTIDSSNTVTDASLFTEGKDGKNETLLFSGTRVQPFYLYWAPDSRRLSLLSSVRGQASLELGIATAGVEGDYRALDHGSPFYWDWRPDSGSVVVHANIGQSGVAAERLSLLDPEKPAGRSDLGVQNGVFQAPSFSPDGLSVAYASSGDSTFTIHLRGVDGSGDRTVASGDGGAFFSFSPDGKRVAWLAASAFQPLPYGKVSVLAFAGNAAPRTLTEEPILAFFWAPNGKTLAFLMPDDGKSIDPMFLQNPRVLSLRLMGYDPASGKTWLIATFPPSRGMLSVLPYFDQYQRSTSIWSPDSRFITFTAFSADGTPALFVARADGNIKPRLLAAGDSAIWSRR
jgi:Tol biopolymer transport system component